MYNINSGRLRHTVIIQSKSNDTDDYGQPLGFTTVTTQKADVQVKSGTQLNEIGTSLTSEVITVLLRYNGLIESNMFLTWKDKTYTIQHISPDEMMRGMVITAMIEGK